MTQQEQVQKFGLAGGPLKAKRLFVKELDSSHFRGKRSLAIMVVNGNQATGANVYGGQLGARYNPERYRSEFSEEKVGKWLGKGYHEATDEEWAELIEAGVIVKAK